MKQLLSLMKFRPHTEKQRNITNTGKRQIRLMINLKK